METPSIPIHDASDVAGARRHAALLCRQIGFDEVQAGNLALVVTEAATNVLKHGGGGEMLVRHLRSNGSEGVEILALDKGPGIRDVPACMRDGYSTRGSPGTGLGAMQRLTHSLDIYTRPGGGTAVLLRLWTKPLNARPHGSTSFKVGAVSVPLAGEIDNGDGWAVREDGQTLSLLVADGLGHGPLAARASRAALEIFAGSRDTPGAMVKRIHHALRSTRGAAVAVSQVSLNEEMVRFAGVGNISGELRGEAACTHMVSQNGTAGHQVYRIQEFTYRRPPKALLILHSDGLSRSWDLAAYPGLAARDPSLVAGVLYRDWNRGRDDATVVVLRCEDVCS